MRGLTRALTCTAAMAVTGLAGLPVRASGLVCDGRQDATAAMNQMLAGGGRVRLPAGVCLVSATVVVGSGTTLTGARRDATIIRSVARATYPTLAVGRPRTPQGARDVDISALTVDGGAVARGPRTSDGILVTGPSSHVRIHDVAVLGAGDNGIEADGTDIDVTDNIVHDNWTNGIYAIGAPGHAAVPPRRAMRIRVLRNRVSHNSRGGLPPARVQTWDGIDIDPITADCLVQGNVVEGNDIILFESGKSVESSGPDQVVGNTVTDSPSNGINVAGPIYGFQVIGNRIDRTDGWGITVNGPSRDGVIRGNIIRGTTKEGIMIENTTRLPGVLRGIDVTGNTVVPGPGPQAAIQVRQGATQIRITGNILRMAPGVAAIDVRGAAAQTLVQGNR